MPGIVSYGAYVPRLRLSRKTISQSVGWYSPLALPGEKAVANYDEDSITMAVAAGIDCLKCLPDGDVSGLYYASTTAPYRERQSAGIIASALNLRDDIRSIEFAGALKAGISALLAACETVQAENDEKVIVCAADTRLGKMGSLHEQCCGDGAAAFLIGGQNVIAELKGNYSLTYDFADHRRIEGEIYERSWEDRWMRDAGYVKFIPRAVSGLLKKYNLEIGYFDKVAYACPYDREHALICKTIGLDPKKIQNNLMSVIGDTGTAYPLMMLAAILEEAKPGDRILVVGYGNGCEALWLEVTEEITRLANRKGVRGHLALRKELTNYEKYAAFKNMIPLEVGIRGEEKVITQLSVLFRERKSVFGLCGVKCRQCGTPQFPPRRVCVNPECGAVDQMDEYRFSDKKGRLFTYTGDNLAFTPSPPAIYGMLDFEGGGRNVFDITDCDLESLNVDMLMELSFRLKYTDEGRGINSYFWKAVPAWKEG